MWEPDEAGELAELDATRKALAEAGKTSGEASKAAAEEVRLSAKALELLSAETRKAAEAVRSPERRELRSR